MFDPPPSLSKPLSASSFDLYNGAATASHSFVASFHTLTLQRAPFPGSVVLSHTLPVGREYVSLDLNEGTLVCLSICNSGG